MSYILCKKKFDLGQRVNSKRVYHHHQHHHHYSGLYHRLHHNLGKRVNSKSGQPTKRWVVKRSRGVGGEAVRNCEHLIMNIMMAIMKITIQLQ